MYITHFLDHTTCAKLCNKVMKSQRYCKTTYNYYKWDDTGSNSIDASCQKYHNMAIHHCLKVLEALAYNIISLLANESNKIISSGINPWLSPYCTRFFIFCKMSISKFYPLQKTIHWSIHSDASIYQWIDTHFAISIWILKYFALQYIDTSQYHPISNNYVHVANYVCIVWSNF